MPAFIETQFPIARLSAEAYKERKANNGQTLTRLGKWWGRKPLVLVRAAILGMLMPASNNPKKDREIFLRILTMDDDGTWQRCKGEIPAAAWREAAAPEIQDEYFGARGFKQGMTDEEKEEVCAQIWEALSAVQQQQLDALRRRPINDLATFDALPYAERITHCDRPENITGPSATAWTEINAHLGTAATSLAELVKQLGSALSVTRRAWAIASAAVVPFAVRARNEKSDFQAVIERALGIACDYLVPRGLDNSWRDLSLAERYYLRALDIESRGERRKGMYEELARGFGVTDIRPLLKSDKANGARMFTPSSLEASLLAPIGGAETNAAALPSRRGRAGAAGTHPFAASPLRHLMFAVRETAAADHSPEPGRQYLRDTFGQGYWTQREPDNCWPDNCWL
ncbi:MAG: DUF1156 domain-containing protein [Nitrosomonadales bacterium]|nr:DUF1156 domain-containing protein [Nitrosomonadales bacterium]